MPQHGGHRGRGPWCALALLVLAPMVTAGDRGPLECEEQAVSANGMLELLPEKPVREWARVRWRTGMDAGSYQVILVAERNKPASIRKSPFSGRAVFQEEPLSLRISPVRTADAGLYEAEFEDAGGELIPRCFRVSVWEPLQPPRVESLVLPEERGWCNLSLLCSAPGAGPVSYSWSCSGDAAGAPEPGPRLHRRLRGDAGPIVCGCNVSNAVSWSSANASIAAACSAAAAGLASIVLGWAVAVAVLVLAIAIALGITCYWWRRRRKDPPRGHIEQALTVYEEVGKAQTVQDPSTTRNEAASGENTIYAVICKAQGPSLPPEPESRTIYSSLQPTRKSPSLRRKRLDPALISTAYAEVTGCPRRPPSQIMPPAPTGHHLS
ncbi:natural killer cell receptor 2B4-like [Neopsephotus bourkii]|uniref:natural killer cell receptor 2B4-like n=1 Tax=Neopsephotus bourkii TaxID=309878 RepID=UPI002AA588BB|nr:natural killer cell receptor 2B4-like [Neopsephotus bourkii]